MCPLWRRGGGPAIPLVIAVCLVAVGVAQEDAEQSDRTPPAAKEKKVPISLDGGASINPAVIGKIVDGTIGLTVEDREAYFRILKLTEKLDPDDLRTLAHQFREDRHEASKYRQRPIEKFPLFVDLFQHPAQYRGHPVSLHGYFRRLVSYDAGKNDQGFKDLYEGWFYPEEGQGNPAVVIFLEKPEGLPIGADITEEVSVTGYFLKMYGYEAHDTTRKAPLILAQTVRWRPQRAPARWNFPPQIYYAITAGIVVIGLLIGLGVRETRVRYERERRARTGQYDTFVPPDDSQPAVLNPPAPSRNGSALEPHH